jgi:CDP-diacylglycerol pyrophosphatase
MSPPRDSGGGLGGRRNAIAVAVVVLAGLLLLGVAARADPNALWTIVQGQCVPNARQNHEARPCAAVDLAGGFAVLKDIRGETQFLLIPTADLSGIESAALLEPQAPNYFADAWQARSFVETALGHPLPRDAISLAINSALNRTQEQLHIHVDCVRADVRDALLRARARIGPSWASLDEPLAGGRYRALRVMGETLAGHDPFKLLAFGPPDVSASMAEHTLVVVGMRFDTGPGFVILDSRADAAGEGTGHGEDLQDHDCALGR